MEKMKELIKNKYFWIILVLLILYFTIVVFLGLNNKEGYLIISNISSLKCNKNDECKSIEQYKILEQDKIYVVYNDMKNLGNYKLRFINKWNFFDLQGTWENIDDGFIAASEETELQVKDFNLRKINPEEMIILNKVLKEKNINYYTELAENEVLEYDFDKDNNIDKIIIASNITDETEDEKLFTIIISIIKNKTSIVAIDINNQYENFSAPAYNIKGIINLFNNKYDYLLITKGYFSEVGSSTSYIYKLTGKTFENIVRN